MEQKDSIHITKQFIVGSDDNPFFGYPQSLGLGPLTMNGTAYFEGPALFGDAATMALAGGGSGTLRPIATVMIAPPPPAIDPTRVGFPGPIIPFGIPCTGLHPPYSLSVQGSTAFLGVVDTTTNVHVGGSLIAQGEVKSRCGTHTLSAKKNFDIPHPSKEGWRLRYTCPEGPSNDVYVRGKVLNRTEIDLPSYWKDFVDLSTITVSLTPIGSHQNVIVKRIDEDKIYLQSNGGMPIHCFYHIFAERKDGEKLISEYPGESPMDYPGNNDEYSISGFHYDTKRI
jgi:hypothetical protein